MKFQGKEIKLSQIFFLALYYGIAQNLPNSYCIIRPVGRVSNRFRVFCVKHIFKKCGNIRTINRKVNFASGRNVEMGDESGIGANTSIPGNTIIGNHVILSRNCFILDKNHIFERTDIPLNDQGCYPPKQTIIEDDCWIGIRCLFTPGHKIGKGSIIGAGSVVTKDVESFSIVAGNPARLIKKRV